MNRSRILFAVVWVAIGSACGLGAQWRFEVEAPFAAARFAGPLVLDVTIERDSDDATSGGVRGVRRVDDDGILRGRLVATWGNDQRLPHRWVGPELAIAAPRQTVRLMLAPAPRYGAGAWRDVSFHDASGGGSVRIGLDGIPFGAFGRRDVAVGIVQFRHRSFDRSLRDALRMRRKPRLGEAATLRADVRRLDPGAFPDHPLALLGFDVLVFDEESLAAIGSAGLDVLVRWIEAGGAALFAFGSGTLDDDAVAALNRLFAGSGLAYSTDDRGVVAVSPDGKHRVGGVPDEGERQPDYDVKHRAEAGRVALVRRPPGATAVSVERADGLARYVFRTDRVFFPPQTAAEQRLDVDLDVADFAPELTPVPLTSVGLLLALYLLGIGPLDWLLARGLRRAWLNWLFFAALTSAAVAAVVAIAHAHFGGRNTDRTVWIADVGSTGGIVRETGVRMLFSSTDRRHEERVRDRLVTPVLLDGGVESGRFVATDAEPIEIRGAFPRNYRIAMRLRQWAPRALRTFEIAPARDDPIARAIAALPADTSAADAVDRLAPVVGARAFEVVVGAERARGGPPPPNGWRPALDAVGRWTYGGSPAHAVFTTVAPTGGRSLDDLAVERGVVRLVVGVAGERGIRVYRRLERAVR